MGQGRSVLKRGDETGSPEGKKASKVLAYMKRRTSKGGGGGMSVGKKTVSAFLQDPAAATTGAFENGLEKKDLNTSRKGEEVTSAVKARDNRRSGDLPLLPKKIHRERESARDWRKGSEYRSINRLSRDAGSPKKKGRLAFLLANWAGDEAT